MLTFLLLLSLWSKGTNKSVLNSSIKTLSSHFLHISSLPMQEIFDPPEKLPENMTRLTTRVQHRHWKSTMWATWHFQALVFKRDLHQPGKILDEVVWLVVFINISLCILKGWNLCSSLLTEGGKKKLPVPEDGFILNIDMSLPLQTPPVDIS